MCILYQHCKNQFSWGQFVHENYFKFKSKQSQLEISLRLLYLNEKFDHLLMTWIINFVFHEMAFIHYVKHNIVISLFYRMCCVFRPANGCSAHSLLVEKDFLMLKQLFPSLTEQNKQKIKGKPHKIMHKRGWK